MRCAGFSERRQFHEQRQNGDTTMIEGIKDDKGWNLKFSVSFLGIQPMVIIDQFSILGISCKPPLQRVEGVFEACINPGFCVHLRAYRIVFYYGAYRRHQGYSCAAPISSICWRAHSLSLSVISPRTANTVW